MSSGSINYKPGFYSGKNPYHDSMLAALRHYNMTSFTKEREFWTLGGAEWWEFRRLTENGIKFGPESYHNIDRNSHITFHDEAVKAYPNTEFFDMYKFWNKPASINFDSVNIMTESNDRIWGDLIDLVLKGMRKSSRLLTNVNLMTDYANMHKTNQDKLFSILEQWLKILYSNINFHGYKLDIFNESIWEPKEFSRTNMFSLHFLTTKEE